MLFRSLDLFPSHDRRAREDSCIAGTKEGGRKAREANLKRDPDFYSKLGRKGGRKTGVVKGFAANPELASRAGSIGGKKSRRGPVKNV